MHVLIAPDGFKDCMSAREVATALEKGLKRILPDASVTVFPMADGGEGTVEAVIGATRGRIIRKTVKDPLMRDVTARYGISGDGETAVIEMASASGLELLSVVDRNPWITSTYGTGQLIADALDRGCRKVLMGIGGSATNDAGTGMAQALGVGFTGPGGPMEVTGGGSIGDIRGILMDGLDERIPHTDIRVACDVSNPLTGKEGASRVYGPQKGAGPEMVERLDRHLEHLAGLIKKQLGIDIGEVPGSGAAGGLGGGLMAFLGARLMNGFGMIAEAAGLEGEILKADLVITGEGKLDLQTAFGKTPFGVAQLAARYGKRVIGVAGTLEEGADKLYGKGFDLILPVIEKPVSLEESIRHAGLWLTRTGERIGRIIQLQVGD
mgnify:CR=1 FL=1